MEYITVTISIIAILLTYMQISLSNKQSLFDRRIDLYEKSERMYGLWIKHRNLLDYKTSDPVVNNMYFSLLINTGFLYEIGPIMKTLLEDDANHKKFLIKMEELKKLSEEILFVFKGNSARNVSLFVNHYQLLLGKMFEYEICSNKLDKRLLKLNEEERVLQQSKEKERKKIIENSLEPKVKTEVDEVIEKLIQISNEIEKDNSFNKLKKQIKLYKFDGCLKKRNYQ